MFPAKNAWKSLTTALLMFGLTAAALAGLASAETVTLSQPTKDSFYYVPGETLTITLGGMDAADTYDVFIYNDTSDVVMHWWNISSASGTLIVTHAINDTWDGYYYLYMNFNGTNNVLDSAGFYVRLFRLSSDADHPVYLPGDTVTVFYHTQRIADQQPMPSGVGRWRITVQRDNGTSFVNEPLGGSISEPRGSFTISLPASTRPGGYTLTTTYNDTTNAHSESSAITIYVGTFNLAVFIDRSFPATYAPGDSVVVSVEAEASGGNTEPTPGVEVTMKVERYDAGNATWNADTSFTERKANTDNAGEVSFLVPLPTTLADDVVLRVRVTAAKGGAPQEASAQFTIKTPTGLTIDLTLDKTTYKPGETMHAKLLFVTTNASLITGSMYEWRISDLNTDRLFVYVYEAGTSTGATKDFAIPADFFGTLYVRVTVYAPDDRSFVRTDQANVFSYTLLLNPSKEMYNPGETIGVNATLVSDRVTSAVFYYTVTPNSGGDPITKGTIQSTGKTAAFTIPIPAEPDDYYLVTVTAEGGGVVATDSLYLSRAKYAAIQITVPDKSYKPGDVVTIHYAFVTVGGATPPTTTTITVYMGHSSAVVPGSSRTFEIDATQRLEGDLLYTIPATTSATGDVTLTARTSSFGSSTTTLYVRPTAGSSPVSAASSTAAYALVIAVIGVVLGVALLFRKPPQGGGARNRGFKVSDDDAPKPRDRVILNDDRVTPQNPGGFAPPTDIGGKNEPPKSL